MSFFDELKRRNVIRVGIAYVIVAWLILQFADVVLNNISAPGWVFQVIMLVLGIGLPVVLIFAWAFEMTPEGLKKEKDVDRDQSIAKQTGRKLDFAIIGILVLGIGYLLADKFWLEEAAGPNVAGVSAETSGAATPTVTQATDPSPANPNSIAVLPFANRSRSEDDAFFSDGIHDDLLTQLAKIEDLKVISRTSVMQYRNTEKTIPEIAAELGVSTILEGGIQRAGKRIRINAQLIDVTTDEHLWAETFDREMTMENIFDIQSEIARQIVMAVKGELSTTEQQALTMAPTDNLEAYEAYLHARAATNRADYSREKYLEAQPWAEKAVKLDPEFAEAWAILAEIHAQAVWIGYDSTPERFIAARKALEQAVKLNPDSATVKAAQADYLYRFNSDYPAALAAYNEAHAMAPGDARIVLYTAITLRRLGRWEDSISAFEEALKMDPANVFIATQMVDTLTWMNEWDQVASLVSQWITRYPDSRDLKGVQVQTKMLHHGDLKSARELFDLLQPWPGNVYVDTATRLASYERDFDAWLALEDTPMFIQSRKNNGDVGLSRGITYYLMGDEDRSRLYLQKQVDYSLAQEPTRTYADAFVLAVLATSWSYLGEHEKALETSEKAMAMLPQEKDHIFGTMIARFHTNLLARAGKRDAALARLAANIDKAEGITRWELYLDPAWDFFRDDERFNELARPKNLQEATR
ncbi:MAG: hypothetical protein BMS9Abin30_0367 [Gammaproteobacteria bacterium]|nr:MAG: hypothetical protein BMS9Abin30_0367 [Gammaproteobacteria bacterium]